MPLTAGQSLTHYEILGPLGAGGMGEVYRARDTRLEREVAIKVLPEHFADDDERLRRFEREAKTLASLNHPNVAGIHGIDQVGDTCFLAMELVPGEDLAARLARGPLPIDEAVDTCRQIAEGLEAAHEAGVVHRDLKPANVRITPGGVVKLLDFGLAKPSLAGASKGGTSKGTVAAQSDSFLVTSEGMILGTPTYMSPEQARGKQVDKRTDIWAFGCVLYECLTGKRAFEGDAFGDLVVSILEREPDLDALPAATPPHVRKLLERTLAKDPRQRLRDIGEARVALGGAEDETAGVVAPSPGRRASWGPPFVLGALTLGVPLALWIALRGAPSGGEPGAPAPSLVFEVPPPPDTRLLQLAISPDGESIVFTAEDASGEVHLWLRDLSNGETRRLEGTLGAGDPFWSPDSRSIGFFSENRLIRTDVATGTSELLRRIEVYRGGAWSVHGQIVHHGTEESLLEVTSLQTGTSTPLTVVDYDSGENNQRFPAFLPDGEHVLYYSRNPMRPELAGLYVASIKTGGTGEPKFLGRTSSSAVFAEPGYLLYRRDAYLMAQAFDVDALSWTGDPITVADDLWYDPSITAMVSVSVSRTGTLVYRTGGAETNELVWLDRAGEVVERVGEPDTYLGIALSADGRQLLVGRPGEGVERYVWLFELDSGDQRQLTFSSDAAGQAWFSPDGERAILGLYHGTRLSLFEKELSSGADPVFLPSPGPSLLTDWPSEDLVLFNAWGEKNQSQAIYLRDMRDGTSRVYKDAPANEGFGVVSPNGRWIAYMSDQSGRFEVYVESFPEPGRRWRISVGSGFQPRWHPAGSELFFLASDRTLMSAEVVPDDDDFEWSTPKALFRTEVDHLGPVKGSASYLVGPDGNRFLFLRRRAQAAAPAVAVLNWTEQLEDR